LWMMSGIGTVVCLRLLDARREPSAREVGGGSKGKSKKKVVGSGLFFAKMSFSLNSQSLLTYHAYVKICANTPRGNRSFLDSS